MGAFDQSKDQPGKRGSQAEEAAGGKRRRAMEGQEEQPTGGAGRPERSERSMPRERPERGSVPGSAPRSTPGSDFDEREQQGLRQRIRDAESGEDENEWA